MKNLKYSGLVSILVFVMGTSGCIETTAVRLHAYDYHRVSLTTILQQPSQDRGIHGAHVRDTGYNSDTTLATSFDARCNSQGDAQVLGIRVPAIWRFTLLDGPCAHTDRAIIEEAVTSDAVLPCENIFQQHSVSIAPSQLDAQAMPSTFTIVGDGLANTYGMPMIEFYDEYGRLTATTYATWVASDGTSLVGSMPGLPYTCYYAVGVSNALSDGSLDLIGATSVEVSNGEALPPLEDPTPEECNPSGQEIADCENCCGVQTYWDYSSCRCYIP